MADMPRLNRSPFFKSFAKAHRVGNVVQKRERLAQRAPDKNDVENGDLQHFSFPPIRQISQSVQQPMPHAQPVQSMQQGAHAQSMHPMQQGPHAAQPMHPMQQGPHAQPMRSIHAQSVAAPGPGGTTVPSLPAALIV